MSRSNKLGFNLPPLMSAHDVSVTQLARDIGVTRTTVYGWLQGGNISPPKLERLAQYFDTTPGQLLYSHGELDRGLLSRVIRGISEEFRQNDTLTCPSDLNWDEIAARIDEGYSALLRGKMQAVQVQRLEALRASL